MIAEQVAEQLDEHERVHHAPPPPPPDPDPEPEPLWRPMVPGSDVTAATRTDQYIDLLSGDHRHFRVENDGVVVRWRDGARVTRGGVDVSGRSDVKLLGAVPGALRIEDALRCVWATNVTRLEVAGFTLGARSANGLYFRGKCSAEVHHGVIADVDRMVRNDGKSGNDFGAMGIDCHDTTADSDIWIHHVIGRNLRVADAPLPPTGYDYSKAAFDQPAPPPHRCFDYNPNDDPAKQGLDEGAFLELWQARGVRVGPAVEVITVQVVVESGRHVATNGPDCSFAIDGLLAHTAGMPSNRVNRGILGRSAARNPLTDEPSLIQHATLVRMEDWGVGTGGSSNFGGALDLIVRDVLNVSPGALFRGRSAGVEPSHNLFAGNGVAGDYGGGAPGSRRIESDPFVDQAGGDFRPRPGSAPIGAGHDGTDVGWTGAGS